jgi:hypothetical protein
VNPCAPSTIDVSSPQKVTDLWADIINELNSRQSIGESSKPSELARKNVDTNFEILLVLQLIFWTATAKIAHLLCPIYMHEQTGQCHGEALS